ncbi:hypothetical protein L873DRAFT_1354308 [Choiromyces venosus 120613-1]|uniref:Uncharacterized protein n=1 Tax=Choiromyces venosus 120613-1 TaxID=1336337 RepID=A0A3N4K1K8_9PEZI|nr:hypothetical protein L873DRAFT_1354308 [Choiromyces venosus 120613-1]
MLHQSTWSGIYGVWWVGRYTVVQYSPTRRRKKEKDVAWCLKLLNLIIFLSFFFCNPPELRSRFCCGRGECAPLLSSPLLHLFCLDAFFSGYIGLPCKERRRRVDERSWLVMMCGGKRGNPSKDKGNEKQ